MVWEGARHWQWSEGVSIRESDDITYGMENEWVSVYIHAVVLYSYCNGPHHSHEALRSDQQELGFVPGFDLHEVSTWAIQTQLWLNVGCTSKPCEVMISMLQKSPARTVTGYNAKSKIMGAKDVEVRYVTPRIRLLPPLKLRRFKGFVPCIPIMAYTDEAQKDVIFVCPTPVSGQDYLSMVASYGDNDKLGHLLDTCRAKLSPTPIYDFIRTIADYFPTEQDSTWEQLKAVLDEGKEWFDMPLPGDWWSILDFYIAAASTSGRGSTHAFLPAAAQFLADFKPREEDTAAPSHTALKRMTTVADLDREWRTLCEGKTDSLMP